MATGLQQQQQQWQKMQRIAAMRDQLQKINQWAQQGNNGALLGELAGQFLMRAIEKAKDKAFITNSEPPSPKYGNYMWDNPDFVGSAVSGAMGGYRPPETNSSYNFEKPEYQSPYERAGETYQSLLPEGTIELMMKEKDLTPSQIPTPENQKTPLYDKYVNENYKPAYNWDNILTTEFNKMLNLPAENADSEMAKMAGGYVNKGLSWEEMDPRLRYKADYVLRVPPIARR